MVKYDARPVQVCSRLHSTGTGLQYSCRLYSGILQTTYYTLYRCTGYCIPYTVNLQHRLAGYSGTLYAIFGIYTVGRYRYWLGS